MKYLSIVFILFVNATTFYCWKNPFSTEEVQTLEEANFMLNTQYKTILRTHDNMSRTIERQAQAYTVFKPKVDSIARLKELYNDVRRTVVEANDAIIGQYKEKKDARQAYWRKALKRGKAYQTENFEKNLIEVIECADKFQKACLNHSLPDSIKTSIIAQQIDLKEWKNRVKSSTQGYASFEMDFLKTELLYVLIDIMKYELGTMDKYFEPSNDYIITTYSKEPLKAGKSATLYIRHTNILTNQDLKISVNGKELLVKNGVANFEEIPTSIGKKTYEVEIESTNPVTGKTETYKETFYYEVVPCN